MEILLIACWLAYAAGAQSEQSRLGLSPAQRATMREQTRHEKAIRKIADKYGKEESKGSKGKDTPAVTPVMTIPEALRSGWRGHTPIERITTPLGRRAGGWAAQGVAWAKDTGRGALHEYRRRRTADGHEDPAPVLVPLPPTYPPAVPPMPTEPPTVGEKPDEAPAADDSPEAEKAPETTVEEPDDGQDWASVYAWPDDKEPETSGPAPSPEPAATEQAPAAPGSGAAPYRNGVGRMAAEVTYDSVMDESDELSLMCDDDLQVYERIRQRAEREIGRADDLIVALEDNGAGQRVIERVARCKEWYQVLLAQVDDLSTNTIAQGEAVITAKAHLQAGQGVYADIAQDMQSVADRDFYVSDNVDGEDTHAHDDNYETKGAA